MNSGLPWSFSCDISSGSKSSRRAWMTVLRPVEYVTLPFREAMDEILCTRICFANVFLPIGTMLHQTLDFGLSTGLRNKFPGTLSPLDDGQRLDKSALCGSRSPSSVLLSRPFCRSRFVSLAVLGLSVFVFDVLLCHGEIT